jgi:cytochrome c553
MEGCRLFRWSCYSGHGRRFDLLAVPYCEVRPSAGSNSVECEASTAAKCRSALRKLPLTLAFVLALAFPCSDAFGQARAGEKAAQVCLLCHKVESLVGAPTLEQQPSKYLVAQINAFKSGKRSGPEMRSNVVRLSAREVQAISDFFSSQRAKPARFGTDPDPKTIALGAASAKELNCAKCHSEDYRGSNDIPRLAGQVPTYLVLKIDEFKRGARPHPAISAAKDKLSDPITEALGAYFGKLEP